ncbi:hypothetical protein CWB98_16985 [Pseudoalteromonas rubra]|uniref:Uncharacterized protein n=1 Tax=Pseudoalteromonas rubra TaxID=43658 RepID=A0A5S3WY64_9GAMM|nr:hypothetical protein CWB98_16985 [Pseudoalteromonas rubra]
MTPATMGLGIALQSLISVVVTENDVVELSLSGFEVLAFVCCSLPATVLSPDAPPLSLDEPPQAESVIAVLIAKKIL